MVRKLNDGPTECGVGLLLNSCMDLAAQESRTACVGAGARATVTG